MKHANWIALSALTLAVCSVQLVWAAADPVIAELDQRVERLTRNPELSGLAVAEIGRARDAVRGLGSNQSRRADVRAVQIGLATDLVAIAEVAARAEVAELELRELERVRSELLVEASRREATIAQREADRLRVQSMARAEDAERARRETEAALEMTEQSAETAQAERQRAEQAQRVAAAQQREATLAKREAELATAAADSLRIQRDTARPARGQRVNLGEGSFAPGNAELTGAAAASLDEAAAMINDSGSGQVLIEGHTDNRGSANLNQVLSQQRAQAVLEALAARGVERGRLRAVGRGAGQPLVTNDSAEGRARNRRVEIVIE